MDIVTIDFETYYDREYSLSRMTTQEYILDPRFEIIMMGIKVNGEKTRVYGGGPSMIGLNTALKDVNWDDAMLVCHNTMFDGAVLAWKLGIHPKRYFCTMMGARPNIIPFTNRGKMGLAEVAATLGRGAKGTQVHHAQGMRLVDMDNKFLKDYSEYCKQDVDLTFNIFKDLVRDLPKSELKMIDLTIRKYTQPILKLDVDKIEEAQAWVKLKKEAALGDAGLQSRDILMSNPKFAEALENLGVVPPTKPSPSNPTSKTYAFAKTDAGMQALLHHDNPQVRLLCEARLLHKSTIEETRLQRFHDIADTGASLAVPLLYYGAHTGRFSGYDKLNLQNLGRGSALRDAITAPSTYDLVVGDLSQIEARITAMLAGQMDLVTAFRDGKDVYSLFAGEKLYGKDISDVSKEERFIGKMCILGLGFGMGFLKFRDSIRAMAGLEITEAEALRIVKAYRGAYRHIVKLWTTAGNAIDVLANGGEMNIGPCKVMQGKIELPNGMYIYYPGIFQDAAGDYWYTYRDGQKKLYGGVIVENIVQALARIVLVAAELRLSDHGYNAAMSVHDELIYAIPEKKSALFALALKAALTQPVDWMPGLPLEAEVDIGKRYSEAK